MNTIRPQAVLWDMDGTIIDTEPAWLRAERDMLAEWGAELTPSDETDWVGIGLWDLALVFQSRGVKLSADEIVYELARRVDEEVFSGEPDWRPGARELISSLYERGIPNVLVTMATRSQAERLAAQFSAGTFAGIVAGDDVDYPKPHPQPYEMGAGVLGVPVGECIAFEDSVTGARSAHAAGAVVIGVPNLVDLGGAPCHRIIDTLHGFDVDDAITLFQEVRMQQ